MAAVNPDSQAVAVAQPGDNNDNDNDMDTGEHNPQGEETNSQNSGNSKAVGKSGNLNSAKKKAGKKVQASVTSYFSPGPTKRHRDLRMDSSDEEMDEVKAPRTGPTPNKDDGKSKKVDAEKEKEIRAVDRLQKKGLVTPEQAKEYKELAEIASREKTYLKDVRRRRLSGEKVDKKSFELDCAVFEAQKHRVKARLSDLSNLANTEAKAVTHVTPDSSPNESLLDSPLFTDDDS